MSQAKRIWIGTPPHRCDICSKPITTEFVDGKTKRGPWGNMCPDCYPTTGVGLGIGLGQRYVKEGEDFVRQPYATTSFGGYSK